MPELFEQFAQTVMRFAACAFVVFLAIASMKFLAALDQNQSRFFDECQASYVNVQECGRLWREARAKPPAA